MISGSTGGIVEAGDGVATNGVGLLFARLAGWLVDLEPSDLDNLEGFKPVGFGAAGRGFGTAVPSDSAPAAGVIFGAKGVCVTLNFGFVVGLIDGFAGSLRGEFWGVKSLIFGCLCFRNVLANFHSLRDIL